MTEVEEMSTIGKKVVRLRSHSASRASQHHGSPQPTRPAAELKRIAQCLQNHQFLKACPERLARHGSTSFPFCVTIRTVDFVPPSEQKDGKANTEYLVKVNLFDMTYKQFFGRTWTGPKGPGRPAGQKSQLKYNQNIYFHTSLNDENIIMVFELVAVTAVGEGQSQQVSCGWTYFSIFRYDGDMPDSYNTQAPKWTQLPVYHGSPRALFTLTEPLDGQLTSIQGCYLTYGIRTHQYMQKAMHLFPENVVLGTHDVVPGLQDGPRDPSNKLAGPDSLRKPKFMRSLPCYVEKISVTLSPSIDKFEEELRNLLIEDVINRQNKVADGSTLQILKRSLQVGIHNGWGYIDEPETVFLTLDTAQPGHRRSQSGSMGKGHRTGSSPTNASRASSLVYKGRVDLHKVLQDPMFTVVFVLTYEFGQPMADEDRRMSLARKSIQVAVRWSAFSPLHNMNTAEHTLQLAGGPGLNPENAFMFRGEPAETAENTGSLTSLKGGTVSFSFHRAQGKENVPSTGAMAASLQVPGTMSARPGSQMSVKTESSSVLNEVHTTSGRPPLPPSRQGASTAPPYPGGYPDGMSPIPPLGLGASPPGTSYMAQYGQPGFQSMPVTPHTGVPMMHQTPRGYIPVEIQHYKDPGTPYVYGWQAQSARLGGSLELQELPFTPVHAPIIATAPGMHSGQGLSRAAYAKLSTAGFPQILDRKGEPPEVVDPADQVNFVAANEEAGKLQANEIVLQFLAFARMLTFDSSGNPSKQPATVFFTFQFYRFPQVTSERLLLGNVEGELSADPNSLPCLLQRLDKDGSVIKGPPGYQVKYHVDPAYLKPGEGRLFVQHLSQQTLHLDVWDGDSLHLIGSTAVELKHLCRQGREAVQVTYELDVMATEYIEHEAPIPAGDVTQDGRVLPVDVRTVRKGRLHLRLANVGHPVDKKLSKTGTIPQPVKPKAVVKGSTSSSAFLGGSLNAINSHTKATRNLKVCKAQHIVEINQELAQVLFSRQEKGDRPSKNAERSRKLARMEALRRTQGSDPPLTSTVRKEKETRSRDLKTIELYRQENKQEGILNMLNQAITTEHVIHPTMGTTEFFEFELKNPYNVEHTIVVECSDPELFVVTDPTEWRHYKMLKEVYTSVEEGMFNMETKSGKPEIFLRPKESVNVPLKFLSFKGDHSVSPQSPANPHQPQVRKGQGHMNKKVEDPLQSRVVKVLFKTQQDKPVSILALRVDPQPHIIDQTFRFHHPEQSFMKKSIRLPALHSLPGVPVGGAGSMQVYVRCSDPNVICESKKVPPGEPHDIFLKVACGSSPQIKKFYVSIYTDPYLSQPIQIWQLYVHSMQRVDVACTEGQTSRFTVVLRGTQASRLVQVFSSHSAEMQVHPNDPFMLAANSLQEIHVGVRPLQTGCKFLYINVVDIEYHQLIRSWLVCVSGRPPTVTKAFELTLPVGGGKGCNKRISYTNPYPNKKVFYLRTNRDDLLQFKDTRLEIAGGGSASIGMRFAPSMSPGSVEILVFINDEDDKNEETFCVKAMYQMM